MPWFLCLVSALIYWLVSYLTDRSSASGPSPGLWRHTDDESAQFCDVQHWIKFAKELEQANFHGIFLADTIGGYDIYKGPHNLAPSIIAGAQFPNIEPLSVISAMAAATKSINFSVTVATTYEHPYYLARRLSTVDHISRGRYVHLFGLVRNAHWSNSIQIGLEC